uniref:ARAD1C13024p n=1 Tax=Blastobotrys adeninivorans TaxID=409370 RepID=A0A060T5J5_BLAAD
MSIVASPSRRVFDSPGPRQPRLDRAPTLENLSFTPRKSSSNKVIGARNSPLRNEPPVVAREPSTPSRMRRVRQGGDRFIPNRATSHTQRSKVDESSSCNGPAASSGYHSSVAEACGIALNTRILEFQPAAPQSSKPVDLRSQYNRPIKAVDAQARRRVAQTPERVLDAPGLIDDYYLNLLDWSSSNQVAIALERSVYVWDASTGSVSSLLDAPASAGYVSSVQWSGDGAYLAVGMADGDVQIWDVESQSKLRSMTGHSARVGVLSWDRHILSSGCRDGSIWNHDVRIADHKVAELRHHRAEVCGLQWRADGSQLASGGNDNIVNIWDARSTSAPKFSKTNHTAAVKAIAWCPWQTNLLATGGGSADKHIHFWNATSGARVNSIDAGSQVTSLKWSNTYREIVSCHGFPDNHLTVWSYPSLTRTADIVAHDSRVLHSALSPDGQTLATCASDENLKFWKIFETVGRKTQAESALAAGKEMGKAMMIR